MELFVGHSDMVGLGVALLLKAAAILALAWVLSAFLRKRSAGLRHLLWSMALGAVLALPLITPWVPALEVEIPRLTALSERLFQASEHARGRAVDLFSATSGAAGDFAELPPTSAHAQEDVAPVDAELWPLSGFLLLGWAAGAAALAFIFAVHLVRIQRATREAVTHADLDELAADVARELHMTRTPPVLLGQVDAPVTWGLARPVVLLPVEASRWDRRRLRIVLLHELAHIRRKDYLPHILAELSCIVYWPNPLVWIARHRLRTEQEQACDDFVLRMGTASYDYAELLLDLARSVQGRRLLPGGVRMAERRGLKARIQAILDPDVERGNVSLLAFAVILVAIAVPAFSAAALRSAGGGDAEEASTEAEPPTATDREDPGAAPSTATTDREDPEAGMGTRAEAFTLTIEAEGGRLTAPMRVRGDAAASGGRFVEVPDQDGYDAPDGGPGAVTFDVDLKDAGAQAVWARAIGEHRNDNSFYVSVDDGEEIRWNIVDRRRSVDRWTWLRVAGEDGAPVRLQPGLHTLTFRNREDGSRLDAIFLSSDPELVPRGRSPLPPPETSIAVGVEAENVADMSGPFLIRADREAYGDRYLSVAHGFESRSTPPEDGRALYEIDVPVDGSYVIWAHAMGPDDDRDSFWIRANHDEWARWNGIEDEDHWEWQLVTDADDDGEIVVFTLESGRNVLELAYREEGARIDRFIVTNNVYAQPSSRDVERPDVSVTFAD